MDSQLIVKLLNRQELLCSLLVVTTGKVLLNMTVNRLNFPREIVGGFVRCCPLVGVRLSKLRSLVLDVQVMCVILKLLQDLCDISMTSLLRVKGNTNRFAWVPMPSAVRILVILVLPPALCNKARFSTASAD